MIAAMMSTVKFEVPNKANSIMYTATVTGMSPTSIFLRIFRAIGPKTNEMTTPTIFGIVTRSVILSLGIFVYVFIM